MTHIQKQTLRKVPYHWVTFESLNVMRTPFMRLVLKGHIEFKEELVDGSKVVFYRRCKDVLGE